MEIRYKADRAKHTRWRKGISWKKVEKWAEEIVGKKADDKAAMEGLEGETAYQKILSLLGKCQRDFQVNERSKIWWDAELDRQAKEVRRLGKGMSRLQRANELQQWAAYRREVLKI